MATNSIGLIIDVDYKGRPAFTQVQGDVDKVAQIMQGKASQAAKTLQQNVHTLGGPQGFGGALKSVLAFSAGIAGVKFGADAILGGVRSMRDFQSEMANVDTQLTGLSSGALEQLRQGILKLNPELGSSAELANAMYDALSAGVPAGNAVRFVGDAARFAKAGLTDASTAVNVITGAMDAYGLAADKASHISDVFFTAVRVGKGSADQLAHSIGAVFPLANTLGLSFEQTAATAAALTKVFPSTAEAITGFRSFLSSAVQNMDKFRAAGIDLKKVMAEGGIVGAMQALRDATGGQVEKIRELIPDTEGLSAVLALSGAQFNNLKTIMGEFNNTAGATQAAFEKQQKTLDAATERFLNTVDRLIQQHGPAVLGVMTDIVNVMTTTLPGALEFGAAMFRALQGTFNVFAGAIIGGVSQLVGALQTLAGAASKVAGWVGLDSVSKQLGSVRDALGRTEKAMSELGAAGLQSGLDLLTGAESAEASQLKLSGAVGQTTAAVTQQGQAAKEALAKQTAEAEAATAKVRALNDAYQTLGLKTPQQLTEAAQKAAAAFSVLKESGTASQSALAEAAQKTKGEIMAAYGKIPPEMQPLFYGIRDVGKDAAQQIGTAFETTGQRMVGSVQKAAAQIEQTYDRMANRRKEIDGIEKGSLMNQKMEGFNTPFAKDLGGLQEQLRDAVRAKADIWRVGAGVKGYYDFAHRESDQIISEIQRRIAALKEQDPQQRDSGERFITDPSSQQNAPVKGSQRDAKSTSAGGAGQRSGGLFEKPSGSGGAGRVTTINNPQFVVDIRGVDEQMINSRNLVQQLLPELRRAVAQGELENTSR